MKIDLVRSPELLLGVNRLETAPEGVAVRRFPEERETGAAIRRYMVRCSAGCRVAGVSDAERIRMEFLVPPPFYSCYEGRIDVTVAGVPGVRSFVLPASAPKAPPQPLVVEFPLPRAASEGSAFTVWLPVQREAVFVSGEAVGASFLRPLPDRGEGILFVGDSITQGFFGAPAGVWNAVIARAVDRDFVNLGIGGEQLAEESADSAAGFAWRDAVIAFGVNDCNGRRDLGDFRKAFRGLCGKLAGDPRRRILVLTPLPWPAGYRAGRREELARYREALADEAAGMRGVSVVGGETLLPESAEFFEDGCHPNAAGMKRIAERLMPHFRRVEA